MRLTHRRGRWQLLLGVVLALSCMHNRPNPPTAPVGPSSIEVDSAYTYRTTASNGKEYGLMYVRFDWGDGDTSTWSGHGETFELAHSWRDGGVYAVRAQAHDDRRESSEWSEPLNVTAVVPPYPYRLVDSSSLIASQLVEVQMLPGGEFIYVTSAWDASLWVVRTSDLQLVAEVPFYARWWGGGGGKRMACSPDGEYVYATHYRHEFLAVVRTADQAVVDSLMLGYDAVTSLAVSPDGRRLFAAVDDDSGIIVVVRLPDFAVEDTIFMLGMDVYVTAMTVSPDGKRLYAANPGDDCVFCIRLSDHTVEWQVPADVYSGPDGLVLTPTGTRLYTLEYECVSARQSADGSLIDSIALQPFWGADIAPDGSYLYLTYRDSSENGALAVARTSDNTVVRIIAMPDEAGDVVSSPDGQRLYVAGGNGKLYVFGR